MQKGGHPSEFIPGEACCADRVALHSKNVRLRVSDPAKGLGLFLIEI